MITIIDNHIYSPRSPYSHQADVWIEMLLYLNYKNVIIIHSSDSDGRATLSRFQNLADESSSKSFEPFVTHLQSY